MYYILTENGSQIVDSQMHRPTQAELDGMAQEFKCSLYVIEGEHYGMTATYAPVNDEAIVQYQYPDDAFWAMVAKK